MNIFNGNGRGEISFRSVTHRSKHGTLEAHAARTRLTIDADRLFVLRALLDLTVSRRRRHWRHFVQRVVIALSGGRRRRRVSSRRIRVRRCRSRIHITNQLLEPATANHIRFAQLTAAVRARAMALSNPFLCAENWLLYYRKKKQSELYVPLCTHSTTSWSRFDTFAGLAVAPCR